MIEALRTPGQRPRLDHALEHLCNLHARVLLGGRCNEKIMMVSWNLETFCTHHLTRSLWRFRLPQQTRFTPGAAAARRSSSSSSSNGRASIRTAATTRDASAHVCRTWYTIQVQFCFDMAGHWPPTIQDWTGGIVLALALCGTCRCDATRAPLLVATSHWQLLIRMGQPGSRPQERQLRQ